MWIKSACTASILPTSASAHRHSCQRWPPEPKFALLSDSAEPVEAKTTASHPNWAVAYGPNWVPKNTHSSLVRQTAHWKMTRMRFLRWHVMWLISCYSSLLEEFLLPDYRVSWSLPGTGTHTLSLQFKWRTERDLSCLWVTEKGNAAILFFYWLQILYN